MCPNLNCISIMMSFLTCITGFLWTLNFCRFWPIMQIWKKGDEMLKKSSPLKLLSQSQPNFAEMILGWPLPKLCPVIQTSNQDGRQAQNRKKGDEILIVHCCFSVSQNELKFKCSYMARNSFNIYSGFFCEIFLSADIYRLCKLGIFW